jgi:hypothetical protein
MFTAVIIHCAVSQEDSDISEEHAASIFSESGDSIFFRNVYPSTRLHGFKTQTTTTWVIFEVLDKFNFSRYR